MSRVFLSKEWLQNPHWIMSGVWAPFHYYLNGIGLMIWDNQILTPKIISILFSGLTLIPFYYLTKREINDKGAFVTTIFLAISPIIFRNSFMALSEIPYLYFLVLALNYFSKAIKTSSFKTMILAGIAITVASGFRYEAWLIMLLLAIITLFTKNWKLILTFGFSACLFPISWLLTNYIETGNAMHGIQGNYDWTIKMMGNNDNVSLESYLRRIWFFPLSWVISVGPFVVFIILKTLFTNKEYQVRSLLFWILFAFFIYNSFQGVLLVQHRFIGTLVVLSLPFFAVYFNDFNSRKKRLLWFYGISTILLSFIYNTNGVKPVPRLQHQSGKVIADLVQKETNYQSALIIDFIDWENTYFTAINSNLPKENIIIIEGASNSQFSVEKIIQLIKSKKETVLILKNNSKLSNNTKFSKLIESSLVNKKDIYNENGVILLKYKLKE